MPPPVEGPATNYLTAAACEQIAREIAEAGGVEIFFIGRRGEDGLVEEVESHAYGSEGAVPVLMNLVQPGEVILHNHPSGYLQPSEADISVSSQVGQLGVGSYIVSNDGKRLRVVIRPHDPKKKVAVDPAQVADLLGPDSVLAREIGLYEDRPQQRKMARAVTAAFNDDGIAVVEAGTGTGKSLAYLVPAILYALENKERVVISTNTINLQEQILTKDLPLVRRAIAREFNAELVKGRSNYVCKRKAEFARGELLKPQQVLIENEFNEELRSVLDWAKSSDSGDRTELPVPPREEVWERVGSEADNCLRVNCKFYETCFFYNSRRRAARADVLVVNHSLLLSDLAVRRESGNWTTAAVLPPSKHVVLDEAHHLEEVATRHLGTMVTRVAVRRLFGRLHRTDSKGARGILPRVTDALEKMRRDGHIDESFAGWKILSAEILPAVGSVRDTADFLLEDFAYAFMDIARLEVPDGRLEHRVRITPQLRHHDRWEEDCAARLAAIGKELGNFAEMNRAAIKAFAELPEDAVKDFVNIGMEWRSVTERLEALRQRTLGMLKDDAEVCRWVELSSDRRRRLNVKLCSAPVSVAKVLRDSLHSRMKSEVLTSATLTVDSDFRFLFDRVGIADDIKPQALRQTENEEAEHENDEEENAPAARPLESLRLDTPFDYTSQVFFGIPTDLGDPRHRGFDERLSTLIVRAVRQSGGRAFVLFTSWGQMKRLHDMCAPEIRAMGITCLVQGEEGRDRLLRRFREDETSVLFATSSFWEGVDVRGRALELLIIAKLPFAVPSDPVTEAQFEHLRSLGRDPFNELVVPRAIIRLKQGFGRLIRSKTDRGAILIGDERVVRMGYGQRFLRSLPEMDIRCLPTEGLVGELKVFFAGETAKTA